MYKRQILESSILWQNSVDISLGPQISSFHSTLLATSCVVDGGLNDVLNLFSAIGWSGNNLVLDPLFVDAAAGDYHLSPASPCINAGDPAYVAAPEETDIDGEPRVAGAAVDMGADELP